jgi:hypothetical protein
MFGVVSRNFVAARHPFLKRVSGCIQSTCFCHRNHFFVFRNEHAQSTTLGPKLLFGVVLRNFVAARHPFQKWVSGAYKHEFSPLEPFLHFSQRTCPIHYFRSDEDINTNTSTSTPAAPSPAQAPSSPVQAPPLPPGPVTRSRARELNYIMLLKNEGPEG